MIEYLRKSSIPEKIEFLYFEEREILLDGKRTIVIPALQSKANDPKSKARALASKFFNRLKERKYGEIKSTIVDNLPIKDIQAITLHPREHEKGGNVIKCVVTYGDTKFLVDMKENMFFEAVYAKGMKRGAKLNGEFIWMEEFFNKLKYIRLVRVNSTRYNNIEKLKNNLLIKPLSKKVLKEGSVYYSRNHTKYLFCGFVDYRKYPLKDKYNFDTIKVASNLNSLKEYKKSILLYELPRDFNFLKEYVFSELNIKKFKIVNDHTLIGKCEEKPIIKDDIVTSLRQATKNKITYLLSDENKYNDYKLMEYFKTNQLYLNMYKWKEEKQKIFDINLLLTFK